MQNYSKDIFPSDTKKNPKDCMVVTLRSGREIKSIKEEEKKKIEKEEKEEIGKETKLSCLELAEEIEKEEVHIEQQVDEEELKKNEEK